MLSPLLSGRCLILAMSYLSFFRVMGDVVSAPSRRLAARGRCHAAWAAGRRTAFSAPPAAVAPGSQRPMAPMACRGRRGLRAARRRGVPRSCGATAGAEGCAGRGVSLHSMRSCTVSFLGRVLAKLKEGPDIRMIAFGSLVEMLRCVYRLCTCSSVDSRRVPGVGGRQIGTTSWVAALALMIQIAG
mmetsp:Transcript_2119/g.5218  ORF Transcript_2119/g.5218 Transcript_2119/m.5218 type:complete len:186 (+) Transcript_2119:46-603(+)